ncbi:amino acid ABC transporter substrate-binding protein, PAAT family [Devosia sp. YR412]|uniref:ABC transporter substrate-binding protein n=1 Tax=Devosia sp. YR412 TaxID=1881030 RepID=UPI0008BA13CA|nr:ABC transporter substrate-binding protein [Devosia sp. YR412]SEP67309.1 amino acid ABC transporter substrate-binding protein, PAAT family [Devosia sp. YR412]
MTASSLKLLLAGLALAALTGTAFAQSAFDLGPEQPGRIHAQPNPEAIAAIPADFKFANDGQFTVAVTLGDPPLGTYASDSKTPVGSEPDFAWLIAEALGLEPNLVPVAWADWPLGVTSGKYDAVVSNVTVTEERKERLDFSTYRQDVLGFYVRSDSPIQSITEPKDIAGLKVITSSGTNQEKIILEWDRLNVEAGLAPVEIQYYDDSAASQLAIQSGRADVNFNPNPTLSYSAAVTGATRLVGVQNGGWPQTAEIAVALRKDTGLVDAVTIAINGLIESGDYAKTLERWNLAAEAIPEAKTNPPGLPKT